MESDRVTVAAADLVTSSTDTAITLTVFGTGIWDGALYVPSGPMIPHAELRQPAPETIHITEVFAAFVNRAVNCSDAFGVSVVVPGTTLIVIGGGVVTVTCAVALTLWSDCRVAETVTTLGDGEMEGAV